MRKVKISPSNTQSAHAQHHSWFTYNSQNSIHAVEKNGVHKWRNFIKAKAFLLLALTRSRSEWNHLLIPVHRFLFYPLPCCQNAGYLNKPPKRVFNIYNMYASTYVMFGRFSTQGRGHTEGPILLFASHYSQRWEGCSNCDKNQSTILWNLFQRWE